MAGDFRRLSAPERFDLDAVLHPGRVYAHPRDVAGHPGLSLREKRAILSSWASDVCAQAWIDEERSAVTFDDVMDALRSLEPPPPGKPARCRLRLRLRRKSRGCDESESATG